MEFTLTEIAQITNGKLFTTKLFSNQAINEIVTDSRTVFRGRHALFFALVGPRNNGHQFIQILIEKGVRAFVVSDPATINESAAFILVEETTAALQKLAAFSRSKFNQPVVGITGSNGKTIVKEWLHHLLSTKFRIVRSPKSYNSQVGVPLSVLLLNNKYNLTIFEAGISQPGEMTKLANIIHPEIGIFTNIGDAHQENFESIQQKIREKLLLFEGCQKLVYRTDPENINREVTNFCQAHSIEKISWSLQKSAANIQFSIKKSADFTVITADIGIEKFQFKIPFTNDSATENACHCFAACYALTGNPKEILPRFETLEPVAMRLEIKQGVNQCLLINDFYNSDLNSLTIALSVLNQQAAKAHLHKIIILSDIQQTGMPQADLYKKVNELLTDWQIDEVIGIGPEISNHSTLFSTKKKFYPTLNDFERQSNRNSFRSAAILIKGARQFTFERISELLQQKAHQTVLNVNLNALVDNLNIFRSLLKPETKIMVMVKAFSYGSGDVEIAKLLQYQNVDYLAVAVADEGVQLRNAGISTPIIVMNPEQHSFQNIIDFRLEPNIYSAGLLKSFLKIARQNATEHFPVHLKTDTGMNRLGLKDNAEIREVISLLAKNNLAKIKSVFSHLVASDDPAYDPFTLEQIALFEQKAALLSNSLSYPFDRHILNSAGIERFTNKQFEMVRLGIGLYGVSATGLPLQNIGELKSTISQIKTVEPGETVGYSRKGVLSKKSKIAVVPLGYADGLDRKLGNRNGHAFVNGKRVPIIGNICMDMLMLDITGVHAKPGDDVEFFGEHISISEVAEKAGTIPYEILTGISQRVKRVYIQE
ncbi:MAG: bifunctional UDP-N-acetylmuramoyl-tripeptide:D-alanyl-D-alanine ligase/alanine racemase [Prolixibacteraceae bacterium]|nr:bifunctional UDP-N-acetylmuramoyl-tripeptide:D-alanyl-D-alanine ligase/alanine racemase [Prolixibacteraceae bacterium]